ncbi:hypothetical protein L226DRAFT_612538 [Lentinus tigrinus ALCF2SS1-7]|uniref:uncharacterized protein n=1 Tax=Lentinus tigrinus ALCF2SS1-7 TaxID=1328758 RepID=UPI001165EEE5|nr:hypothetical protein L226DRAFT_612538 [Lentinus tigrinus ALCF2SS1-7]
MPKVLSKTYTPPVPPRGPRNKPHISLLRANISPEHFAEFTGIKSGVARQAINRAKLASKDNKGSDMATAPSYARSPSATYPCPLPIRPSPSSGAFQTRASARSAEQSSLLLGSLIATGRIPAGHPYLTYAVAQTAGYSCFNALEAPEQRIALPNPGYVPIPPYRPHSGVQTHVTALPGIHTPPYTPVVQDACMSHQCATSQNWLMPAASYPSHEQYAAVEAYANYPRASQPFAGASILAHETNSRASSHLMRESCAVRYTSDAAIAPRQPHERAVFPSHIGRSRALQVERMDARYESFTGAQLGSEPIVADRWKDTMASGHPPTAVLSQVPWYQDAEDLCQAVRNAEQRGDSIEVHNLIDNLVYFACHQQCQTCPQRGSTSVDIASELQGII